MKTSLHIDRNSLERVISKRRFPIGFYEYFLTAFLLVLVTAMSLCALFLIRGFNITAPLQYGLIGIVVIYGVSVLIRIIRSFRSTFFFRNFVTGRGPEEAKNEIIALFENKRIAFKQAENMDNFLVSMEADTSGKHIIETSIIFLDGYGLLNSRNRNTSILYLKKSSIAQIVIGYFGSLRLRPDRSIKN